jgi:hypothetical protein
MKMRILLFIIIMIGVWGIRQTFIPDAIPPADIEMNDYRVIIQSPLLPIFISIAVFILIFKDVIKKRVKEK